MGARARAGVGTWVCRGVGAGVTMSVWARGCPGVPAHGCDGVCCFFSCSYLFVSHCFNNTRHSTTYIGHSTTRPDPFADFLVFWVTLCASVMCRGAALDMIKIPEYFSTLHGEGTFDRCRVRRGSMSFQPWGMRCLL